MRRTDKRYVADVIGDQLQPAKNEGGHEHLADSDVGLHESLQFLRAKFDNLAGLAHTRAYQRAAAREHVQFTSKLSGFMLNDSEFALVGGLNDVESSAGDQEERRHLTLLDQHFALSYFAFATHGRDALNVRICELRKQLLAAFRRKGWQLLHWSGSHKAGLDAPRSIKGI